jgi:hypothetical protein
MRTRTTILTGALLLASAALAGAQDSAQTPPADAKLTATQSVPPAPTQVARPATTASPDIPAVTAPKLGTVDFGFRGTNINGDASRYYRFRDWRDGGYLSGFRFEKVTDASLWHAEATNVGYRDQRYFAEFQAIGKLTGNGSGTRFPLHQRHTRTLYTVSKSGTFTVDDNASAASVGRDDAANVIGQATPFDARTQRNTGLFNLTYAASRDVDVKFAVRNSLRDGYNLQSLNFGFSNTIESEVPLNDRTTDVKAAIEFANAKGLLTIGYNGSWYNNEITAYRFDNPIRYTDIVGGPSLGQMSTWPSNNMQTVNLNGRYGLPGRTKASAAISLGNSSQNQALLPATVNTRSWRPCSSGRARRRRRARCRWSRSIRGRPSISG